MNTQTEETSGTRFPLTQAQLDERDRRFTYHPPKDSQPERYVALREEAKRLATLILQTVPESREQALALTNLDQAVFWANAGIARRG